MNIQLCRVLVGSVQSPAEVCPPNCVLSASQPSADLDAVVPTPTAAGVPTLSEPPSHTHTHTLCLKKNDNDVAHYNFNTH